MLKALKYKSIEKIFVAREVSEGVGMKVRRVIGLKELPRLDPFLMLDHASVKLPDGAPDHPHRGFETVSYALEGSFYHEDFKGHKGYLNSGDVQWMTAGRGIVHSEMPASKDEASVGLQLWINLPNKLRMIEPRYQEIKKKEIPIVEKDGANVKVIAGKAYDTQGPIECKTPVFYLDVSMSSNGKYEQKIPARWNTIVYVHKGSGIFGENKVEAKAPVGVVIKTTDEEQILRVETKNEACQFILLSGEPIGEKIYQYGPFVTGSEKELNAAIEDYQYGRNGFEGAREWRSDIRKLSRLGQQGL